LSEGLVSGGGSSCHLLGAVEKPKSELAGAAANPLNIALDA
jgi:hypothetical protein